MMMTTRSSLLKGISPAGGKTLHGAVLFFALLCTMTWLDCSTAPTSPEAELASLKRSASRRLSSYRFDPSSSLVSRITPVPRFLLDDIRKLDGREDYNSYALTAGERTMAERYLRLLPPRYRKVMEERLIGIYFISPFTGSGLADWVMDDNGKVHAVLVINPEVFRHSLSDWLTYREKSCFRDDGSGVTVRVDAGTRYSGLMYLLLHEAAHIVDYVENHTPYVEPVLKSVTGRSAVGMPFTRGVWEEYGKPVSSAAYNLREDITFYGLSGGAKIPAGKAPELYREFMKSPFVSLYGSQSWAEDFAEMAMAYHLAVKLREPFAVVVEKNGVELSRFSPLGSPRVKARLGYLGKLY